MMKISISNPVVLQARYFNTSEHEYALTLVKSSNVDILTKIQPTFLNEAEIYKLCQLKNVENGAKIDIIVEVRQVKKMIDDRFDECFEIQIRDPT